MRTIIKNKYTLLYVICCFSFMPMRAQEEHPEFFPQGTTWEEAWYHYQEGDTRAYYIYNRYTVSGDTIVDDILYKRVIKERRVLESYEYNDEIYEYYGIPDLGSYTVNPDVFNWNNTGPWHWEPVSVLNYCIREENGMVYIRNRLYGTEEKIVYDFNWEEGKQIEEYNFNSELYDTYTFDNIIEITLLDGTIEQALTYSNSNEPRIIRGIGNLDGLFNPLGIIIWDGKPNFSHIINFYRDGTLLYEWDPTEYLENKWGVTVIKPMDMSSVKNEGNTYTITGVQIDKNTTLPPGIYIKNGKKLIVK